MHKLWNLMNYTNKQKICVIFAQNTKLCVSTISYNCLFLRVFVFHCNRYSTVNTALLNYLETFFLSVLYLYNLSFKSSFLKNDGTALQKKRVS